MNKEEISAGYVMVPRELLERATEAIIDRALLGGEA